MRLTRFSGNGMADASSDANHDHQPLVDPENSYSTLSTKREFSSNSIRTEKHHGRPLSGLFYTGNPDKLLRSPFESKPFNALCQKIPSFNSKGYTSFIDLEDSRNDSLLCEDMRGLTYVISDISSLSNDWDSPENLENPRNWSLWKKIFHTALPASFGFLLTIGTSAYTPAIPFIMSAFSVSREVAILPLSFYTLGFAIGPLFYAALSEVYGRRIVYWISMPLFLIFTMLCGFANNITFLIIMRFTAALTGSGTLAVGAGTIQDLWDNKAQPIAALSFILAPFLGPCLGPLIGAYAISKNNYDWRWSIWTVMVIAPPIAIMSIFLQETSKSYILSSKNFGTLETKIPQSRDKVAIYLQKLRHAVKVPFHMMIFEPLVAFLSIYTGFAFAMLFSFFSSYNFVFLVVYHLNQIQIGFIFVGILVGFILAIITFGLFDITIYRKEERRCQGSPAPEHRLYNAMLGSILLPISLFWFALAPSANTHWVIPALSGIPFGWATLSIFISTTAYLVEVYQTTSSASAIAANGILRYGLGAAFPLFTIQIYFALGIHWAGCVFAFFSLLLIPVPWIFFRKGKYLRSHSYYETSTA